MSSAGRPLRFLALTLGGWTIARVALLWPVAVTPATPSPQMTGQTNVPPPRWRAESADRMVIAARPEDKGRPGQEPSAMGRAATSTRDVYNLPPVAAAHAALVLEADLTPTAVLHADKGVVPLPSQPVPIAQGRSRLAGSAWSIARGGSNGTLLGGQLGASQAGARLTYAVGEARRVALSVRFATPLSGRGKEAAVGLDWQPTHLPLHLLAEQRVSLDGERGGPTLLMIGGINPTPVLAGFRLEAYGQAGVIKRDEVQAFGDGAARLTHKLTSIGRAKIDLGVGAWGAAQLGVRRFDVGPSIGAVVPVARTAVRLTLDWRERIAGEARPGSGPALSIGADL